MVYSHSNLKLSPIYDMNISPMFLIDSVWFTFNRKNSN